jgi:flavin-dependent dehydrogenase
LSSTLRLWLQEFSDRLNVTCPTLRGAFVPTGDDIMLAPVSDVYLIGDAAGLIAPGSWGGIYDALKSAKILARALNSGSSFEKDMQQTVANITGVSNDLWGYYFSRWLSVARKKVESTQITQDA